MKRSPGRPRAVFLDAGGVLLLPHPAVVADALRSAGLPANQIGFAEVARAHDVAMRAVDGVSEEQAASDASPRYLPAFVADLLGGSGTDAAVSALGPLFRGPALALWTQVVPGTMEGMRRIAATGVQVAVVSNSDGSVTRLLERAGICQVGPGTGVPVRAIIDSSVVGVAKPDPRIFQIALRAVDLGDAGEALHVGDSRRFDVAGAAEAGIVPVHFNPMRTCDDASHRHVSALAGVAAIIESG